MDVGCLRKAALEGAPWRYKNTSPFSAIPLGKMNRRWTPSFRYPILTPEGRASVELKRIRYVSRFSRTLTSEEIESLVQRAEGKNAVLGITGIFMATGNLFYQLIEGPEDAIDRLFATILSDERHRDILVLETETEVTGRFFPDWSMRRIEIDDAAHARLAPMASLLEQIVNTRRELARQTHQLERALWQELAAHRTVG